MHGRELLLISAQRDQSQNFLADCQTYSDERECALRPAVADLRAHCPSRSPVKSIPRMFPIPGNLLESFVATAPANRTTPSIYRWWCFHHLVILYHLNRSNV